MRIVHSRVQHAVGQGSFHSAFVLIETASGERRFDYVYDCGALRGRGPSPALLTSIDRMDLEPRPDSGGRPVIDLLVLSHFDRDHIIGADLLAARFVVRRIVVPYLTPTELMLVLASQAGELDEAHVRQLHALATGDGNGSLFNVPVTQVLPGDGGGPVGTAGGNQDPPAGPQRGPEVQGDERLRPRNGPPGNLSATEEGTGAPIGATLAPHMAMCVALPDMSSPAPWKLKYWNRGVSDDLVYELFDALVRCRFPLHALAEPNAVQELIDWLEPSKNRKALLAAYARAIAAHKPDWAREAAGRRLANFLSLCMYSGPASKVAKWSERSSKSPGQRFTQRWFYRHAAHAGGPLSPQRTGWFGTGDAPLGEAGVWDDFRTHYANELNHAATVQVPHHGAAPKAGPRFFNAGLLPEPGMRAVISVGTTNTYGHPTTQVINQAFAQQAQLEIVTEESWLGFHEWFGFEL